VLDDTDRFVRWRVQLMERAVRKLNFASGPTAMVQVHDYKGASVMRFDKRVKAASKRIIQIFQVPPPPPSPQPPPHTHNPPHPPSTPTTPVLSTASLLTPPLPPRTTTPSSWRASSS
jgi:hypothetical protein